MMAFRRFFSFGLAFSTFLLLMFAQATQAQSSSTQIIVTGGNGVPTGIAKFDSNTGVLTALPGPVTTNVNSISTGFAINPAGTFLFIASENLNQYSQVSVFVINQTTGALTEVPNSPFAVGLGDSPDAITTDLSGKFLYVANANMVLTTGVAFDQGEIDSYTIAADGQLSPTPGELTAPNGTIGPSPVRGLWLSPNGRQIYFAGGYQNSGNDVFLMNIDPSTGDISGNVAGAGVTGNVDSLTGSPDSKYIVETESTVCGAIIVFSEDPVTGGLTGGGIDWYSAETGGPCGQSSFIAFDPTGKFLYTAWGIFQFNQGAVTQPATPTSGALSPPYVLEPRGKYIVTTYAGLSINSVSPADGSLTPISTLSNLGGTEVAISGAQIPNQPIALFSPTGLTFQNAGVGVASSPQTITFANSGTATLNISNISVTGTNAADFAQTNTCTSNTLAAGSNCVFTVTFTPSTTAAETAAITIADDASGSPHSAALSATAYVVPPPSPSVTPSSLTFASTAVGATSTQTFTIGNSGGQSLTVTGITIGGSNPGDFAQSGSCSSIAANSTCTVTVTFQPQAQGVRSATVVAAFSNATPATESVTVSGTATAPTAPFVVTPSGPSTSTVKPGQAATYAMNFTPAAGFSGTASVACAVSPVGPTCSVSPSSIQVAASNSPATTPVTITASAPAAARKSATPASAMAGGFGSLPATFSVSLLICFGLFAFAVPGDLRKRGVTVRSGAALLLLFAIGLTAACGGGGSGGGGTTSQTYTVTVTTTAGSSTQTLNYSMTVQ